MKTSFLLKICVGFPLILFVDYILMVIIGCSTCLLGFGNDFYCGSYCVFGKIILGLSFILFFMLIFPDIKEMVKSKKNASTTEK